MEKKFQLNVELKNEQFVITSITTNSETILRRITHMLGGLIDADSISYTINSDDAYTVENLEPDDEDYFIPNPWLEDNEDRWY